MTNKDISGQIQKIDSTHGTLPIKVSNEVVGHLSIGLYRNFARAVKELISNSYDADATEVKIKLDLKNDQIIIRDNGNGMDLVQIRDRFLYIARRTNPTDTPDELGRKRIGSFGIGFLSTFPYCKKFILITKKKGDTKSIQIEITTDAFFRENSFQIAEVEVPYTISDSDLMQDQGETIVILQQIAKHILEDLKGEFHGSSSIDKLGGFEKFKWTLAQYAPIQFPPQRKDLNQFFYYPNRIPMRLWLNAEEIYRNVSQNANILEKGENKIGNIEFKYAIMSPNEPVRPNEAKGLQVRLRDVAVGFPRDFDVSKFTGKVLGKLNYLCGEVHILKGLDSALMIDRDHFSYTEEVANLEIFFRSKLIKWSDELEKWAKSDKELFEIITEIDHPEEIIEELKNLNILHFSKERLRIPKEVSISKTKRTKTASVPNKLKEALEKNRDYTVIIDKNEISENIAPITVFPENNKVIINENHPIFSEEIILFNKKYRVNYESRDLIDNNNSVCKFDKSKNIVIYNTKHPLFKSKLNEDIVKRLSLGLLIISEEDIFGENLLFKLNNLLEDVFLRS